MFCFGDICEWFELTVNVEHLKESGLWWSAIAMNNCESCECMYAGKTFVAVLTMVLPGMYRPRFALLFVIRIYLF